MSITRAMVKKALAGMTLVGVTVACAIGQIDHSSKPVPFDVIRTLVKYSSKSPDPKNIGVVIALDFNGNPYYFFPEGTRVTRPTLPIPAKQLNSLDSIATASLSSSPPCILVYGAGGIIRVCPPG